MKPSERRTTPEPRTTVQILKEGGCGELLPPQLTPENVGWKAYGLASLPYEWTSPFFVIDVGDCSELSWPTEEEVSRCASRANLRVEKPLMVRSSGTRETLSERGKLSSRKCPSGRVVETIKELTSQLAGRHEGRILWIVQEHHSAKCKGHFSNERRLSYEKRDWVVETEPRNGYPVNSSPVAVRQWRDGTAYDIGSLTCNSEARISVCLKQVAMWSHQFGSRLHFEWVWDGYRVVLVQIDREDSISGVDPRKLLPSSIPSVDPEGLSLFRVATEDDFNTYGKLKNARLYQQLGYQMPPFYVLQDSAAIRAVFDGGGLVDAFKEDLAILTRRPLIIRTDGVDIPSSKREMLPRSDELRSVEDAEQWLTGPFKQKATESALTGSNLILIAHHYIPSLASAWARAEPNRPFVRIEALWGIPEGIYWFSHDTFEVDTRLPELPQVPYADTKLAARRRRRYKESFIASNAQGDWVPHKTSPPCDWSPTISNEKWLSEIAWTTKLIAQATKEPVSVMWFVGNHKSATPHSVLPWFHSKCELGTPKAAPRRKFRSSTDFMIVTVEDWDALKAATSDRAQVERVIVEPADPNLIRNREFAEELAALAKDRGFVVELSGGVLSHAYYVLRRSGARVECVDLFGGDEDTIEYFKVVRDRIPESILKRGERAGVLQLTGDALIAALKQKLVEEAFEALDASSGEELIGELADVAEVVQALGVALGLDPSRIENDRKEKTRKRGGFEKGYMLTTTGTPQSLVTTDTAPNLQEELVTISDPALVPRRPPYRRPDFRQAGDIEVEKMLTTEIELNKLVSEVREAVNIEFSPASRLEALDFSLVLELKRVGAVLRPTVRVRRTPTQLPLSLDNSQLSLFDDHWHKG